MIGALGDHCREGYRLGLDASPLPSGEGVGGRAGGFRPRAALGYITLGAIGMLEAVGLVPPMSEDLEEALGELAAQDTRCAPGVPASVNPAKALAAEIDDRVPVIWGAE